MKQAVYSLCYHIVLETDQRRPMISPGLGDGLQRLFERMIRQHGGVVVGSGGISDHVHLLVRLPPTAVVSEIVRVLKAESSLWAARNRASDLVWGEGYGAFSVGKAQAPEVLELLQRQESHHRRRSYAHELLALMNGVVDVRTDGSSGIPIPACRGRPSAGDSATECAP